MEKAFKKVTRLSLEEGIRKAKRDYMQRPQDWLMIGGGESITTIESLGKVFHVKADSEDVEKVLKKYRWYMKDGYAVTSIAYKRVKMHHLVIGKPQVGKEVDHINRDRVDNRRCNLRIVSSSENSLNNAAVGVRKKGNKWEVNICIEGNKLFKVFSTKKEALNWRNHFFFFRYMSEKEKKERKGLKIYEAFYRKLLPKHVPAMTPKTDTLELFYALDKKSMDGILLREMMCELASNLPDDNIRLVRGELHEMKSKLVKI